MKKYLAHYSKAVEKERKRKSHLKAVYITFFVSVDCQILRADVVIEERDTIFKCPQVVSCFLAGNLPLYSSYYVHTEWICKYANINIHIK